MNFLEVDLSTSSVREGRIETGLSVGYAGGRGVTSRLLYDSTGPGEDALSPDAPLFFGTGPLTGIPFPMAGRYIATAKSPLTNTIFSSSCGGRLGVYLKKAGFDLLIIKGAASSPTYLSIEKGHVQLHDGAGLWGQRKGEVKKRLREKHGADISILLIGRAGETEVLFANIENDGRYLGRGGLGAVLGSKNLKAIVIKGKGKIRAANSEDLAFVGYECRKWLAANPVTSQGLPRFGTGVLLNFMRETGLLSTKNHRFPAPFESSKISGEMVTSSLLQRKRACLFCPVACGRVTKHGDGPEYESLWSLGVNLSLFDIEKVAALNGLCNELGLDTISTGGAIGMALELSETGRLGHAIEYGDAEVVRGLVEDIAERRGLGEILSLGTKRMGVRFGAEESGVQVKGLELPAYDPKGAYGNALGYITSNRGGCHLPGYLIGAELLGVPKLIDRHGVQGKASLLALYQNLFAFMDTLILCRFASFAVPGDYYARIASAVQGTKITWEDALKTGERIWNLERLFNVREGVETDRLPSRCSDVPVDEMLREYYEVRGWDELGVPTEKRLKELDL